MLQVLILIIGFIILIKGADLFVDGSSSIAGNLGISKMLVGLTIVAFGTSAPEFAVSVKSMLSHSGEMVLGNVIGSNTINILLILGITALIKPIKVTSDTVRKQLPIVLLGTLALSSLFLDNLFDKNMTSTLTRGDAICIILFFGVFMYYLISVALRNRKELKEKEKPKFNIWISILYTLLGIISIVIGSNAVVDSATIIASNLGVSTRIISLTIIAFGTSLPELTTSVVASIKGEEAIAVGNIIGSNIFNIGVVLGIPILLFGTVAPIGFTYLDVFVMILASILLFIFAYSKMEISRKEGIIMLLVFISYYTFILFS